MEETDNLGQLMIATRTNNLFLFSAAQNAPVKK
jgi:hypothetical protein